MNDDESLLSSPDSKTGRLQREALRVLREHEAADMLPTNGRFLFYELEHLDVVSKDLPELVRGIKTPLDPVIEKLREAFGHLIAALELTLEVTGAESQVP